MEPAVKIGTMVIVLKSTLGMAGYIGEVVAGPTPDVDTGAKLWAVKFPREGKAYEKKGDVNSVVPADSIYFLETWLKPVSGLLDDSDITSDMEWQRRREELVLKYNVKPMGKEKV